MKYWIIIGSVLMSFAIIIGAFGAHILKDKITAEYLTVFETGVKYHIYHALGIIIVSLCGLQFHSASLHVSCILFFVGIILFSGSLYTLTITQIKWFGVITPIGGVSFILGWLLAAYKLYQGGTQ